MLKMIKNQKGMTLVELLAVMVIVGIIAAIAIPAIGGVIENARKDSAISTANTLQEAARLYVASEGYTNAGTLKLCAGTSDVVGDASGNCNANLLTLGILDKAPTSPTKDKYENAFVEITIGSNGTITDYKTTLSVTNGKYNISGQDANEMERGDIS